MAFGTIEKCYRTAKDDYVKFDIYVQGEKYSYFQKDDLEPKQGQVILSADVKTKGKYKNLENIILDTPSGSQKPTENQRSSDGAYDDIVWKHGPTVIELMKMSRETGEKLSALIDEMKSGAYYIAKSKGLTAAKAATKTPACEEEPPPLSNEELDELPF